MIHDSTISLADRGLEYPRKQPDDPRAKNCFLALLMLCSMPGFADKVLDHRKPRHLAWGSVGILESKSERCSGIDLELVLLETLTIYICRRAAPPPQN